jgi:hypothetical protein
MDRAAGDSRAPKKREVAKTKGFETIRADDIDPKPSQLTFEQLAKFAELEIRRVSWTGDSLLLRFRSALPISRKWLGLYFVTPSHDSLSFA